MTNVKVSLNSANIKPRFSLIKLFFTLLIMNYLVAPFLFESVAILGDLKGFWQILIIAAASIYLSELISIKIKGKEIF